MKLKQKIALGLVLITASFAGLFLAHNSSAAPTFTAAWIDRSNIQVTGADKTVILTDGKWDASWKYRGILDGCSGTLIDGFAGNLLVGFSDNNGHTGPSAWNDSVSHADLAINYKATPTDTTCASASIKPIHINNWQNAQLSYRWKDSSHEVLLRIDRPGDWTFSKPVKISSGFDSGKTRLFRESETGKDCQDVIDVSADNGTMWLYEQNADHSSTTSNIKSPLNPSSKPDQCWLQSTINDLYPGSADLDDNNTHIPSNYPLPLGDPFTPPGIEGPPATVTGTNEACFKSGWELSWFACPVITAAQTAANAMYGFVEDQLKFTVLQNCPPTASNPKPNCGDSLGQQHDSVHNAWNNFRILVSGLVVILLLIMVISQAIGSGPFDAYTVRKMLPRLVAGVILIQISWPIFSWVVNTVDHLGVGLADIMYAPFGGADALNLNSVMKPFIVQGEVFSWVGIPAMVIFGVVAPFVVIGLILSVLAAIFAGFLTLLFRKIIIILALIFVPVALISWMMPNDGLRKYWKLWWDNFIKALMMFPLIIAIIAGGRIFAKIGSGQSDFVGFFIVLVGFFGPLFILPKTFKWGGSLMQTVGQGINKAQGATLRKQKDFLTNPEKGVGGWWARRQGLHASEYTDQDPFHKRLTNSLKAGRLIPTRRAKGAMIFRGNEFKNKEQELEKAIQERRREKAASRDDNVMAGKQKDLDAITEGARTAAQAQRRGLLGTQKRAERKAKEAMRDLIATGSTLELNSAEVEDTDGKIKKVWQTKMWRDLLNGNPDLYRQVKSDAPDWVPHRTPVGLPKYRGELSDDQKAEASERGMTEDAFYQERYRVTPEQQQLLKTDEEAQWASSLHETVTELDAGNLATLHPTYYERIGDTAREGQKYLRWAETGRDDDGRAIAESEKAQLRIKAAQMQRPAIEFGQLIKRLSKESSSRQYLTRAMGGADTMEHLDAALQFSQVSTGERPGDGELLINPGEPKGIGSMEKIVDWGRTQEAALMRGGGDTDGGDGAATEVEVDLHPGETISPGGVVISPAYRPRSPRDSPASPPPPPAPPPPGTTFNPPPGSIDTPL